MAINSLSRYLCALWNWDQFSPLAPKKVRPSDMDGYLTRNFRQLLLEAKGSGVPVPRAQEITFDEMTYAGNTALVIRGNPGQIIPEDLPKFLDACRTIESCRREPAMVDTIQVWPGPEFSATNADLARLTNEWWDFATNNRPEFAAGPTWQPSLLGGHR